MSATLYLREDKNVLATVNTIRNYLGKTSVDILPMPDGTYGSTSCPIALALDEGISVMGECFITHSQDTADAINYALGFASRAEYVGGSFRIEAPAHVSHFVRCFDEAWATERGLEASEAKLLSLAVQLGRYTGTIDPEADLEAYNRELAVIEEEGIEYEDWDVALSI